MTPEELKEIRSTLEFASQAGAKDEFMDTTFNLLEFIDEHAAQIEALKEKLHHERVAYLRAVNSYHKKDGLEYVAREQLKAEMPEVDWK